MKEFPRFLVTRWQREKVKYKEFWVLVDAKRGLYLDFFTRSVFGDGQQVDYHRLMERPAAKLPTADEEEALDRGDLATAYRLK